ncbi:MAG: toll/interleukin-1 receptor domain-containing protein [Myxococcales bacterium]|nr:toll/interleukin-1 receptor domain-containing protein [Myxococcales bacterium]
MFYLSYARDDADDEGEHFIRRFYDDLTREVAMLLGEPRSAAIGFMDVDLSLAKPVHDALAAAVVEADVLVCMVSPAYVRRDYCKREWDLFRSKGERSAGRILPIIWRRRPGEVWPTRIEEIQYWLTSSDAGRRESLDTYNERGLRHIAARRSAPELDAAYRTVVETIAEHIVALVLAARKEPATPPAQVTLDQIEPPLPPASTSTQADRKWDIFISYANEDLRHAITLRDELAKRGWRCFVAGEDLNHVVRGADWTEALDDVLDVVAALILLVTPEALGSEWVKHEWRTFNMDIIERRTGRLIPVCVRGPGPSELSRSLRRYQCVDAREDPGFALAIAKIAQLLGGAVR